MSAGRDADLLRLLGAVDQGPGAIWEMTDRITELSRLVREARDERDVINERVEAADRALDLLARQLTAIDAHLGPWEPDPAHPRASVGRVQTILNLKVDRERLKAAEHAKSQLQEALAFLRSVLACGETLSPDEDARILALARGVEVRG